MTTKKKPAPKPAPVYEDRFVRLPLAFAQRVDALGKLCELTGDQMASAIFVLEINRQGWIDFNPKTEK